jgi:hypothetical protein
MRLTRRFSLATILLPALAGCARLESIPYSPPQTPQSWLKIQPYLVLRLGGASLTLVQPSSTFFVFLLGLVAIAAGVYFLRRREGQQSRKWWGIALLLWGLGALAAGVSYEGLSYEIKCAGRELCAWTSGWEIAYLLLSVASLDAMLAAVAYSSAAGRLRRALLAYAMLNIVAYTIVVLIGVLALVPFLISFEMLILFVAPNIVIFLILNGWRAYRYRDGLDIALLVTWIWLVAAIGLYFLYLSLDFGGELWRQGLWFSENDVLHIGLITWMVVIVLALPGRMVDLPDPSVSPLKS